VHVVAGLVRELRAGRPADWDAGDAVDRDVCGGGGRRASTGGSVLDQVDSNGPDATVVAAMRHLVTFLDGQWWSGTGRRRRGPGHRPRGAVCLRFRPQKVTMSGYVIGLARGLLGAGGRHSVVSLWPVDDRTGCLTMVAFAEAIADGDTVADALHMAPQRIRLASLASARTGMPNSPSQPMPRRSPQAGAPRATCLPCPRACLHSLTHPTWWAPVIHIEM
jgi:hypothetical protein